MIFVFGFMDVFILIVKGCVCVKSFFFFGVEVVDFFYLVILI